MIGAHDAAAGADAVDPRFGSDDLIEPPYPADTRAKGWRFDLDYEQIEQSSTWALAGPEAKPWLLMLWFTSWKQAPCASLPADEEVIAAMIGMPPKVWAKHSKVMLRGWAKAPDRRLYHKVLTEKVRQMLDKRRSEAERKAGYRRGTSALSHGTDSGQAADSHGKAADSTRKAIPTPTPTPTPSLSGKKHPPPPRRRGANFDAALAVLPGWLSDDLWKRWCKSRREAGKPITETACQQQLLKLGKWKAAGLDVNKALDDAICGNWQGLYEPKTNGHAAPTTEAPALSPGQWQ